MLSLSFAFFSSTVDKKVGVVEQLDISWGVETDRWVIKSLPISSTENAGEENNTDCDLLRLDCVYSQFIYDYQ